MLTNYFYFTETTNDFLHYHTMQILVLVIFASFSLVGYVSGSPRKTLVPTPIGRMLFSIICYRASYNTQSYLLFPVVERQITKQSIIIRLHKETLIYFLNLFVYYKININEGNLWLGLPVTFQELPNSVCFKDKVYNIIGALAKVTVIL